jgi:ABC-type amino acid transport substrate-binding protein
MKKILTWILIILILFLTLKLFNNNATEVKQNSTSISKYSSIIEKGSIEVGYIPYDKSFILDPNTWEYSWIFYEVMEEVWKRLELKVIYKYELWWGDMITALTNDKIDMMVTWIWPTASRSKYIEYINPLYYSPVYAYTRSDNYSFDNNLDSINKSNVRIWVIDSEITNVISDNDFPLATKISSSQLTNIDQLMLDIIAKKTDLTFLEPSVAQSFMKNNPWKIKKIVSNKPLRKFQNSMVVKKWEFSLKTMIDNTIMEMENEWFIKKIVDKYDNNQWYFIQ